MDLGSRIAAWRKVRGWTQEQLGKKVGVTKAAVSMWEGGKHQGKPLQENLDKVVQALGLTYQQFYGRVSKRAAA